MRLQLSLVLSLLGALSLQARAQELDSSARLLVYSDDDATEVTTSLVDSQIALDSGITVGAHALVDSVSSASVDVVSAATGRWSEDRLEVGLRTSYEQGPNTLRASAQRSEENDWRSYSARLGLTRLLFRKNTSLSLDYGYTHNQVGRAGDPNFEESLHSHSTELGVSQLYDAKTRVGASYSLQRLSGFQSSVYRYLRLADGSAHAEQHPDTRLRQALGVYALRALPYDMSLRISYRLYGDDWGIRSHTLRLLHRTAIGERVSTRVEGRLYLQDEADFYRDLYLAPARYMSRDRELASFWNLGVHTGLAVVVGPVEIDGKVGLIRYEFENFSALPERLALVAGGGAHLTW